MKNHNFLKNILSPLVITILVLIAASAQGDLALAAPLMVGDPEFVITVQTDNVGDSADWEFTIPTIGTGYNYNVDCDNDGTPEVIGHTTGDYTCDYGSGNEGTYQIAITANISGAGFPRIYFNDDGDKLKLLSIENWGTGAWTSMNGAFYGCTNLTSTASDAPDLSGVTDLSFMFANAAVFNANIGTWDTSHVTKMQQMFYQASAFNQDLSIWNTAAVKDFSYMFSHAAVFNQDIGSWNTAAATAMQGMFFGATAFNQDISGWNTANVTDMGDMFRMASAFNQDNSGWNTEKVTDMQLMFQDAFAFNQNIGSWDTSKVTDMSQMFFNAAAFNQDIGSWDTGAVTYMDRMFYNADAFNQDISGWDTANVTDMSLMFYAADAFNQNIGSWNTAKVIDMHEMFGLAPAFDQDIGSWDVGLLASASGMFNGVALSTANYDALLIGWEAKILQPGVTFDGGTSTYCYGETARSNMSSLDSWTITDSGKDCSEYDPFVITVQTDNGGD